MNPRWRTMEQTSVLFTKGPWSLSDSTVRTVSVHWVLLFSYYFTTPAAGPGASGATHKALTSRAERLSTECFRRTAASQLRCSTSTSSSRVAVKRCLAALESWRSALELIGPVSLAVAWRGGGTETLSTQDAAVRFVALSQTACVTPGDAPTVVTAVGTWWWKQHNFSNTGGFHSFKGLFHMHS